MTRLRILLKNNSHSTAFVAFFEGVLLWHDSLIELFLLIFLLYFSHHTGYFTIVECITLRRVWAFDFRLETLGVAGNSYFWAAGFLSVLPHVVTAVWESIGEEGLSRISNQSVNQRGSDNTAFELAEVEAVLWHKSAPIFFAAFVRHFFRHLTQLFLKVI